MLQTVDNYFSFGADTKSYYFNFDSRISYDNNDKRKIGEKLEINLNDYQAKSPNNTFFLFFKDEDKKASKNEYDLIISVKKSKNEKEEDVYLTQTGNYVGKFVWDGLEIDIKSRFSNIFLERMLNFANDVFLDDVSIMGNKVDENFDISKYIIYYMFVLNLEKAFLLGLPKSYTSIKHHEMKLKGKIDINRFIKYDIPFQGKISSTSREQKEIQEIIDTLYKAVKIIEKSGKGFTKNISHIKTHIKQHRSNSYVSNETINKALKSKALQNPIFAPYKKVLEYARFIINGSNLEEKKDGKNETYGFLVNVAELFEIYITKLLQKEFSEWSVDSPKIELYKNPDMFYTRKIIPDIVMTNGEHVMVFDTKYKRMNMVGKNQNGAGDVDRNDFFQINTYMSYYQNHQEKYNLIAGGLLYPMDNFEQVRCYSSNWLGNHQTKFIIDGIELDGNLEAQSNEPKFAVIAQRENNFIQRIRSLIC
ncbi:MAG: hypothetical protein WC274_03680 [Sulfurimonas sp.]|jgi:5-methylcytosine-specific restriction endonuclease McrBC regulatory subunit McrC